MLSLCRCVVSFNILSLVSVSDQTLACMRNAHHHFLDFEFRLFHSSTDDTQDKMLTFCPTCTNMLTVSEERILLVELQGGDGRTRSRDGGTRWRPQTQTQRHQTQMQTQRVRDKGTARDERRSLMTLCFGEAKLLSGSGLVVLAEVIRWTYDTGHQRHTTETSIKYEYGRDAEYGGVYWRVLRLLPYGALLEWDIRCQGHADIRQMLNGGTV